MSWAHSLIKLSSYEVELLQKRLAEVVERRGQLELKLMLLEAEGEAEAIKARQDAEAGWCHAGFAEGLKARKAEVRAEIERVMLEEEGARDALAQAFEDQKKYEHIAETTRIAQVRETARRETAMLDEMGLRRAAGAGR